MTIVESMTAMLLIVLSFGIGMMIYLNILSSEQVVARTRANLILHQVVEQTRLQNRYIDETLEIEGLLIEKQISDYGALPDNYLLHLQAFDGRDQLLGEIKQVLYLPATL